MQRGKRSAAVFAQASQPDGSLCAWDRFVIYKRGRGAKRVNKPQLLTVRGLEFTEGQLLDVVVGYIEQQPVRGACPASGKR